jgi:hypothetical protein
MTSAEHYRVLAADCGARARREYVPQMRKEWDRLARCYRRLAEQADHNSMTDIVYERPLWPLPDTDPAR